MIFLAPIAVLLYLFRNILFFKQFFFNNDVLLAHLPFLIYRGMHGPFIAQDILSGFPLYVSTNAIWFAPATTALFSRIAPTTAYIFLTVLYMLLAYGCTYLYARKIGLSSAASVVSAAAFVFSGQVMLWAASIINTGFYFLLPACLYLYELSKGKAGSRRCLWLALAGLCMGSGWLSAHVEYVFFIHAFYGVYVLLREWWPKESGALRRSAYALLIPFSVSFVVGLPAIAATLHFKSESVRVTGVSLASVLQSGYLPWDYVHFLLPSVQISFIPFNSPNLYIGLLPLLLALIAMLRSRQMRNAYVFLYTGLFLFCMVAAIRYSPLWLTLHQLPFWDSFREPPRIMFLGDFALAMLAGFGLDFVLSKKESDDWHSARFIKNLRILLYLAISIFAVMTAVRFFFFAAIERRIDAYFIAHRYAGTTQLPLGHYLAVISQYLHQVLDQFSFYNFQIWTLCLFAALSLWWFGYLRRVSAARAGALAVLLVAANFAFAYSNYFETVPTGLLLEEPRTAAFLHAREAASRAPYRIYSLLPAETMYTQSVACHLSSEDTLVLEKELLQPNAGMFWNIDTAEGYENYMPARVSEFLNYVGSESTLNPSPLFLERISWGQKVSILLSRLNALRAANVKYIVSGTPLHDPGLTQVFYEEVTGCRSPVYVYELSGVWPRYFVTNAATLSKVVNTEAASSTLGELDSHTQPAVLLDSPQELVGKKDRLQTAEVLPETGENTLSFKTPACTDACVLFVGNAYLQGWSATVDGVKTPIVRANYLYMAVMLTPGVHAVVLTYPKPL